MKYIEDKDLNFLKDVTSEDLDNLVKILTSTKTEELTKRELYKKFYPNHNMYWEEIASELQYFGGNSIANLVRRKGIVYAEILRDVCKNLGIEFNTYLSTEEIEDLLLKTDKEKGILENIKKQARNLDLKDGFLFLVSIPALAIKKLSDPAYRITVEAVYEIANLRKKYNFMSKEELLEITKNNPLNMIKLEEKNSIADKKQPTQEVSSGKKGVGKILLYTTGATVIGVGAVAAAPFTGGGSVLGAATLASSLAGAGVIATGTGALVGATGTYLAMKENEEKEERDIEIAKLRKKAEKFDEGFKQVVSQIQADKEHFNYIIASTAIGICVANIDGEISQEELTEIDEFIGGIASLNYPSYVIEIIEKLKHNPPTFNEAMKHLEKIKVAHRESIRDLIELVIHADGIVVEKETAFLQAFDSSIKMIEYKPDLEVNTDNKFILELQKRFID